MNAVAQTCLAWSSTADSIWRSARPIAGTLAETYLRHRKCYVPDVGELRFLPTRHNKAPALIARITVFYSGAVVALSTVDIYRPNGRTT